MCGRAGDVDDFGQAAEPAAAAVPVASPPVLVLLPPSEGKAAGGDGPPVGRRPVLSTPDLARARSDLLDALRRAARADPAALARGLRLPAGVAAAALAADARARTAPTMPALDRYTGVVYQALDVASLTPAARRRAEELVLVSSGLWGVVRGGDLVPDYRVPASGTVPGLGGVTAHWRAPLAAAMPAVVGDHAVLDLRSTDYSGMWRPTGELAERVVAVRVLAAAGCRRPAYDVGGELPRQDGQGPGGAAPGDEPAPPHRPDGRAVPTRPRPGPAGRAALAGPVPPGGRPGRPLPLSPPLSRRRPPAGPIGGPATDVPSSL